MTTDERTDTIEGTHLGLAVEEPRPGEELRTDQLIVNMGPQHPSTHGVLRLILTVDGEWIRSAEPDIGFLHRGFEKLGESRTYEQNIFLTDRWDYVSSMSNNLAMVLAIERLLDIEVPERAQWLRMLVAELQRIASHLVFIAAFGLDMGAITPFFYCFRERERILDLFEMLCGARLTYHYMRIGGVVADVDEEFLERLRELIPYLHQRFDEIDELLTENPIFLVRTKGIGVIPPQVAKAYGLTGPMIRASGIPYDVRRNHPYLFYDRVEWKVVTHDGCDCWSRIWVRSQEMRQSLNIVEQVMERLEKMPSGGIRAKLPRTLRPPKDDCYVAVEAPRGELGIYIVSDGSQKPYRVKIRGPSFVNLSLVSQLLPGTKIADVVAILGSFDLVMGEVDR
ncbi:MAG TPA: NADH-quinone oxidoreductase subunit D [Armatimonadetes bacterium]|nr:NADH-quinone oxidoreductase subunit D [Armatimonadota bacterium]